MQINFCVITNLIKRIERGFLLILSFLVLIILSGCAINRVSILNPQQSVHPIKESEVKFFSSFKDISEPWRIEGMLSVHRVPLVSNNAENRVAIIKETAAAQGINAVVGLQSLSGDGHISVSNAILASMGTKWQKEDQDKSKFIVLLPPVDFKIDKDASINKFGDYIREYIQYLLSYTKGYYVTSVRQLSE
jgi:hypothetical protein